MKKKNISHKGRPFSLYIFFSISLFLSIVHLSCQSVREITQAADLNVAMSQFHLNLRWNRISLAARYIHADIKEEFISSWKNHSKSFKINEIEILELYEFKEEQTATAMMRLYYVDQKTQVLREMTQEEKWNLLDGRWLCTKYLSFK